MEEKEQPTLKLNFHGRIIDHHGPDFLLDGVNQYSTDIQYRNNLNREIYPITA